MHIVGNSWDASGYKSHAVYATAHDAASATAVSSVAEAEVIGQWYRDSDSKFYVFRAGIFFDTSVLNGVAPLVAYLRLTFYKEATVDTEFNVTVVSGDDLGATGFLLADYGDLLDDTTALADLIDTTSIPVNASMQPIGSFYQVTVTLNAAGLAKINPSGITKFALRSSRDIGSNAPTTLLPEERVKFLAFENDVNDLYRPTLIVGNIYPTDPATRVSSLIHRYNRGVYNLEMLFGDVVSESGIPSIDTLVKRAYEPKKEEPKEVTPQYEPPSSIIPWYEPQVQSWITPNQGTGWYKNELGGWEWRGGGVPTEPPPLDKETLW